MARAVPDSSIHLPDLRDDDVHELLVAFYAVVARDELLAPYFADVDMTVHMPHVVAFWSSLLFHTGQYSGNAFLPHARMPGLTTAHFARWVGTLEATVSARFSGPAAEFMKQLGHRIAFGMQVRLGISPGTT